MVNTAGLALGALLTLVVVVLHFTRGTEYPIPDDISQEVLEHRAESVPETDFPEPMNRSIGAGGGAAAGAVAGGETEGELEEGEAEEGEADPSAIPDDEAETYEVEYVKEGATIDVKENETLLEAGEDEGWDLPYACRQGQCVSCGGRITDGPAEDYVVHHTNQMLGGEELEEGYTLTCVAYPIADHSLETRETP